MKKGIGVRQRDITDCGAACLASVAAYYDLHVAVGRIRQFAGTDKQGTTVLGLIQAAEKINFQVKAGKANISMLSEIPLPAIAHVRLSNNLNHYVVLYEIRKKYVKLRIF